MPQTYPRKKPCKGVAGRSLGASGSCRVLGRRARNRATSSGATATHESMKRLGRGKIRICSAAESRTSSQALGWMERTGKEYQAAPGFRLRARGSVETRLG